MAFVIVKVLPSCESTILRKPRFQFSLNNSSSIKNKLFKDTDVGRLIYQQTEVGAIRQTFS